MKAWCGYKTWCMFPSLLSGSRDAVSWDLDIALHSITTRPLPYLKRAVALCGPYIRSDNAPSTTPRCKGPHFIWLATTILYYVATCCAFVWYAPTKMFRKQKVLTECALALVATRFLASSTVNITITICAFTGKKSTKTSSAAPLDAAAFEWD